MTPLISLVDAAISVDICLEDAASEANSVSVASTVLRTPAKEDSKSNEALTAAVPSVRMGVVMTVVSVLPAVVIFLLTVSQVLPKLSSDLPAAVHADLAVESWRLVSSISARVALTAAFARFNAASASRTASEACCIFSGSLACCAA